MIITHETPIPHIDALLILGRGIDEDGNLSETSDQRAQLAGELALGPLEGVPMVFTGGYSWRQVAAGERPPSEGPAMLNRAVERMGLDEAPAHFAAEDTSTSTTENIINSMPLLNLGWGDKLGVMSDQLHFKAKRPQYLSKLILPGVVMVPLELPELVKPTKAEIAEEFLVTAATRAFMLRVKDRGWHGIKHAHPQKVMARQRLLERVNPLSHSSLPPQPTVAGFHASSRDEL